MVHFATAERSVRPGSVQAITFGEEVGEGAGLGFVDFRRGTVHTLEGDLSLGPATVRRESDAFGTFLVKHVRLVVRQVKPSPRSPDCQRIGGVETEEPHTGFPVALDIEAHIEFGEGRNPREVGKWAAHHPGHPKWDDANP